jgi:hypothetical protein
MKCICTGFSICRKVIKYQTTNQEIVIKFVCKIEKKDIRAVSDLLREFFCWGTKLFGENQIIQVCKGAHSLGI